MPCVNRFVTFRRLSPCGRELRRGLFHVFNMLALSFDGQVTTVSDLPARLVTRLEALRINRVGGLRPAFFAMTNIGANYRPYLFMT